MCRPRKPGFYKTGALPSSLFKHLTLQVLLWEAVVCVGVEEELGHLLVQLEMVPTKVTRPYTLDNAQLKLFSLQPPQQVWPTSVNQQSVATDSCIGAVESVFASTIPVYSEKSGHSGNSDLWSWSRAGIPDDPTDVQLAPRCQLKALFQLIHHLRHHL